MDNPALEAHPHTESHYMKLWQWLISTAIAGVTMAISLLVFLGSVIYTKSDGLALEMRIGKLEHKVDDNETAQRNDITHMRDTIDQIYRLLIEKKK